MTPAPDTVVLIHGLWMTPRSWEHWVARYERRGFKVLAPAWPGMEAGVEALNADPSPIAALDIARVVDHYAGIIGALARPPIVMGHSFGGAFTQVLLDRGLGAAGVGIASATVKGIHDLPLSTLRAVSPALRNPFKAGPPASLTPKQFRYAFANTLGEEESRALYDRYHVPAATTVLREGAFQNLRRRATTTVDFDNEHRAPMLFVGFERDHVIPSKATRHNAEKYSGRSHTDFKAFPGRPHFPGAPGWEEVADYALDWAVEHAQHVRVPPLAAPA